jgi:hypothetical protein
MKYKNVGLSAWRLKPQQANPEEVAFAKKWNEQNQEKGILSYLLDPQNRGSSAHVSDRDRMVAATVIQWLGSPVGQNFLRELGYEKKEEKE